MRQIISIKTSGIKNISKDVEILFGERTISSTKKGSIKGIYGFNGCGKTALLISILIYKNSVIMQNYLLQNSTTNLLDDFLNISTQEYNFEIIYQISESIALKHKISIKKDNTKSNYIFDNESISYSNKRTINETFLPLIEISKGKINYVSNKLKFDNSFVIKDFSSNSFFELLTNYINENKDNNLTLNSKEFIFLIKAMNICKNINVYLKDQELSRYDNKFLDLSVMMVELALENFLKTFTIGDDFQVGNYYNKFVRKEDIEKYKLTLKKLVKFLQLFKPNLIDIELNLRENRDGFLIERVFAYDKYKINEVFESSGIKELCGLFDAINSASNGKIVFVDEIGTSINSIFLSRIISYIINYTDSQFCFTTHNLELMNALKKVKGSISILGSDNDIETWIQKGNRSPISDYTQGFIANSPNNLEDFDLLGVFSD